MKKFLIRFTIVFLSFYVLLFVIQAVFNYKLRTSGDDDHSLWNKVASGKVNADILAIGSSRALVHYDPNILKEKLNLDTYVLGMNSTGYDLQQIIRNLYFKNNSAPKIIIQNVDVVSFNSTTSFFKPVYLPYYTLKNSLIIQEVDDQAIAEYFLPMYKYRYYVEHYDKLFQENENIKVNGYMERDLTWDEFIEEFDPDPNRKPLDYDSFNYKKGYENIESLIEVSNKMQSDLYLIWAPEYYTRFKSEIPYTDIIRKIFIEIADNNKHVFFLDFTNDSLIYKKDNFYNDFHLNKKGVSQFVPKVADSIAKYSHLNIEK